MMTLKMKMSKFWITLILHVFLLSFTRGQEIDSIVLKDETYPVEECNQADNEISINFKKMGLTEVGSKFLSSPYVVALSLRENDITQIARDSLALLPNLCYLDLSWNPLIRHIFSLELPAKLKVLVLDGIVEPYNPYYGNNYQQRSKISRTYPEVEYLYLRNNRLSKFDSDWDLLFPNVKRLFLTRNKFGSGSLYNIPKSVTHLYLEYNSIVKFDIENIENLVSLSLDGNKFLSDNYFSSNLHLRGATNLRFLSLSDNKFTDIEPTTFRDMVNLKILKLSINLISHLNDLNLNFTPNLETLLLNNNKLNKIPELCSRNLESLSLQYNEIRSVSASSFCRNMPLKYLNLAGNHISSIELDTFKNVKTLEVLDLSDNILHELPVDWNLSLNLLINLYLNDNYFEDLDDLFLNNSPALENLYLKNNSIKTLNTDSLRNIKSLYLHLM